MVRLYFYLPLKNFFSYSQGIFITQQQLADKIKKTAILYR